MKRASELVRTCAKDDTHRCFCLCYIDARILSTTRVPHLSMASLVVLHLQKAVTETDSREGTFVDTRGSRAD